uniref:Probable alpha-ketoglutarate-dependent hypophosphite dioxygenase n=1 Tax=Ciona intestinalis TaxID=7719 RepID=F6ULA8_CIOIN|nr:uncharacterized protein LOC100185721 isoform X2 [Ciona intestinalis]|eukprot:XP_002131620.1 uncharacterized protein LOC100185721 isoform X2 [Ciona intestinalis]
MTEDLDWSTVQQDTGLFIQKPTQATDWRKFKLAQTQIDQYFRNGFLAPIKVLNDEECDLLLEDYKKFIESDGHPYFYEFHKNQTGDSNNVLMHALGHWRITRAFHDLIYHPAICVPSSQLISGDNVECSVRFWHDQLFAKPAKYGGCVAWHQDYSYWTRTYPMKHLTIHIALDDQTEENGCIHYIPGSHRWNRDGKPLPVTDFNFKNMESIKTILTKDEKQKFFPTPCKLKRGEVSFHHPLAVHGSYPNRSDQPRRAAVVNYIADGVGSSVDGCLLEGTNIMSKGEKLGGQFYPLVYDQKWAN